MPLVWLPDSDATFCFLCAAVFGFFKRKHHCRKCGKICCNSCTPFRMRVPEHGFNSKVRVCTKCCYDSMQPPKFPSAVRSEADQPASAIPPHMLNEIQSNNQHNNNNNNNNNHNRYPRHQSVHFPSTPIPSSPSYHRSQSFYNKPKVSSSPTPTPTSKSFMFSPRTNHSSSVSHSFVAPRINNHRSSFSSPSPSLSLSLSSPSRAQAVEYALPANWAYMEEIHVGPILSYPIQYGLPSGVKTVELLGGFSLQRGLNGFRLLRPNGPPALLNIEHTYVPQYVLETHSSHAPSLQPQTEKGIVKTGPALGMVPGQQNWARGSVCLDGVRMTWHPKEGDVIHFLIGPEVVLVPIDRGGQVKGIVSKVDGILGIAERTREPNPSLSPRTIWYFHFPSKEVRNMWHFSITYNIAHLLSDDDHFQLIKAEFLRKCTDFEVPDVNGLDWLGIIDILYSDI